MEEQALEWWNSLGPNPLLGLIERGSLTTKYYGSDRISKSLKNSEIVNIYKSEVGENEEELEELVDKGGAPIGGDYPSAGGDNEYTSTGNPKGAMQQTTDDAEKEAYGGGKSKYMFGYAGGSFREGVEKKVSPSRIKMREMVEDIFTKKTFDNDIAKNFQNNDIIRNGIPPLEAMADSNPIIVRKVQLLSDVISRNSVSGEEKAIILNHLLDMDISDIPNDYKNELKKKL